MTKTQLLAYGSVWQTYRRFHYGKPQLRGWKKFKNWLQECLGRVDELWACQLHESVGVHYSMHQTEAAAWAELERQVNRRNWL